MAKAKAVQSANPARGGAAPWARRLRVLHLYAGALFAPAIAFFAVSGALQEFGLHQPRPDSGEAPPVWIARLAAVHKHQTLALPAKAVAPRKKPKSTGRDAPAAREAPPPAGMATVILRVFFCAASVGLLASTLTGLYLAFRFSRRPRLVAAMTAAGAATPLLLLMMR